MIDRSLNYGRHHIRRFLTHVNPCLKVLDIGAGHGNDLLIAREAHPSAQLYALESYPPYVEELRGKGIEVHAVNIEREDYPFAPESLDVVMGNQILEHTKELFWILDQVSKILRVGGHFIIGVPNLASLHNRLLLALGKQPTPIKNNSAHVRGFTKGDLVNLANSGFTGGYRLNDSGGSNFYPFPPLLAKPLAAVLPSMAFGLFLDFQKLKSYQDEYLRYPVDQQLETNFYLGASR